MKERSSTLSTYTIALQKTFEKQAENTISKRQTQKSCVQTGQIVSEWRARWRQLLLFLHRLHKNRYVLKAGAWSYLTSFHHHWLAVAEVKQSGLTGSRSIDFPLESKLSKAQPPTCPCPQSGWTKNRPQVYSTAPMPGLMGKCYRLCVETGPRLQQISKDHKNTGEARGM